MAPPYSAECQGDRTLNPSEMDELVRRSPLGHFARYANAALSRRFLDIPVADLDRDDLLAVLGWYFMRTVEMPSDRDAKARAEAEAFRRFVEDGSRD